MNLMSNKIKLSKNKDANDKGEIYDIEKLNATIAKLNEIKLKDEAISVLESSCKEDITGTLNVTKQSISTQTPPSDPFINTVILELEKLPERLRSQAKYEIQQVLFKYQMILITDNRNTASSLQITWSPSEKEEEDDKISFKKYS